MENWINVVPPIYRKGRLIERQSLDCMLVRWTQLDPSIEGNYICDDCGYIPPEFQYRTVTGTPYCVGYDKKVDVYSQVSYDSGETWTTTATRTTLVEHNSEDCGYTPPPIYRWNNLNPCIDYYCVGTTKYYKQQKQKSYDDGVTWQNVVPSEYKEGLIYETESSNCGYVPLNAKWVALYTNGSIESAACDSTSAITQGEISRDDAVIIKVGPCTKSINYAAFSGFGKLISVTIPDSVEYIGDWSFYGSNRNLVSLTVNSITPPNIGDKAFTGLTCPIYVPCESIDAYKTAYGWSGYTDLIQCAEYCVERCIEPQYRTIYGEPYCVGYDKYETMYSQVSYDSGVTWQTTATTEQVIEHDSADCGYIPPEPQFRTISGETYCSGNTGCDKYVDVYSQVSYDLGVTWETTATTTALVEEKSYDCGYRERATSGTPYCDGYAKKVEVYSQVSYDSGTTWNTTATSVSTIELYSEDCGYIPPSGETQYLTFIVQDNGTFTFNGTSGGDIVNDTIYYSLDSGSTWSTLASGATSPTINSGNKIMWKGELQSYGGIGTFSSTGRYSVEGNAMSLLYGDNFIGQTTIGQNALSRLFQGSTGLTSVENMVLPATSLLRACYYGMFSGCTALTTAMEILPFTGTVPQSAYANMFYGCTSLTRAPELPGKLGSSSGYKNAYSGMFSGCTSLNYIKCLTTNVPSDDYGYPYCTGGWVYGVAATGTFVKNASTTWPTGTKWVNSSIPSGWTVIDAT